MRRRGWRFALLGTTSLLLLARPAHPQVAATIDLGASVVRYDGFLPSGAAAVTPAFTWDGARASATVRGTYLRFASGNRSLQGAVGASGFASLGRGWRGEVAVSGGGSSYAGFPSFWHALGALRLHYSAHARGVVIGASAGRSAFGPTPPARPVATASILAWLRRDRLALVGFVNRVMVGDTQYNDIDLTARVQQGKVTLETTVGARFWSRGAGRGVFGEGSGTWTLNEQIAIVLATGRYPTDPVRGSIAGRYAAVSVRLRLRAVSRAGPPPLVHRSGASDDAPASVTLVVRPGRDALVRLVIQGPAADLADRVEIAGDFTGWVPVPLRPTAGSSWQALLTVPRGVHRINVRVNGGRWLAPSGTTRVHDDDYGGEVGVFVVP